MSNTGIATSNPAISLDQTTPGTTDSVSVKTKTVSEAHTTALAASLVIKGSSGKLHALTGYNNSASAQYIQIHNAAALPADASVPLIVLKAQPGDNFYWEAPANSPYPFSTGIVVCNSSTAATKTIGAADCWFNALYE